MKILLIEPNYETKFAPLGLMRISNMHKSKGDEVKYIKGIKKIKYKPDKIYLTTLFTYQYKECVKTIRYYKKLFPKADFWIGGILASNRPELFSNENVNVHVGLLHEAEKHTPDYTLFPDIDYSLTFTSRGCINKCGFCVVPKLEGNLVPRPKWVDDINMNKKKIIFMDNNWLAKDKKTWQEDVRQLKELKKKGINQMDFNQSLDCRIMSEWHMKQLKGLPIYPMRFAFDHMGEDKHAQNAIKLSKKYGFNEVRFDVLFNWMDTPDDFYYRIKEIIKLGGKAIPMKYAPLDTIHRKHLGKNWTETERDGVGRINPYSNGEISSHTVEEFEYFFGKNAKEFRKLLNYPNISKLSKLKMEKVKKNKIWEKIQK